MTADLKRRVMGMIGRGIVKRVNDADGMQLLQIKLSANHLVDDVEHFHPFGHTAVPEVGAECIVWAVGGDRSHLIATVVDRRKRPKNMTAGQVALYDSAGNMVKLCNNGTAEVMGNTDYAALASKVDAELVKIAAALSGVAGAGGVLTGANTYITPVPVGSTKVKMS